MTAIRDTALLEQSLLKTLCPILGVLEASLYRFDDTNGTVRVLHHHHSQVLDEDGPSRLIERTEEIHNATDIAPDVTLLLENVKLLAKPCTRARQNDGRFLIAYPLFGGAEICGQLVFSRERELRPTEDLIIRGVLEVFSNYHDLLDTSQRDQLTGLLNRQALENSFDRIWAILARSSDSARGGKRRAEAAQRQHWVAIIDIDHFKKVNDNFGHIVGDEVLLLTARIMSASLRSCDLLFRYGGEEFVLLFSAQGSEQALTVVERLRVAVQLHSFPQVGQLTISIGLSCANLCDLPREVLSWADQALYQAKHLGRNRVCDYQSLVAAGVVEAPEYGAFELF